MARVERVTSAANPLLKEVRRAGARGAATASGLWIAESFHLLEEAIRSELRVPVTITSEASLERAKLFAPDRLVVLSDELFEEIATTQNSQGVMALVEPPRWEVRNLFRRTSPVVVLDGIQDPGNAGAIARAAEAFGASGMMFIRGTVSPENPKTLRAAAGSLFRIPYVAGVTPGEAIAALTGAGRKMWAAMPSGPVVRMLEDVSLERACALVVGNEGRGVGPEFLEVAEGLSIATLHVESLNAAMAAAVLLYEAQRQRVAKAMA